MLSRENSLLKAQIAQEAWMAFSWNSSRFITAWAQSAHREVGRSDFGKVRWGQMVKGVVRHLRSLNFIWWGVEHQCHWRVLTRQEGRETEGGRSWTWSDSDFRKTGLVAEWRILVDYRWASVEARRQTLQDFSSILKLLCSSKSPGGLFQHIVELYPQRFGFRGSGIRNMGLHS